MKRESDAGNEDGIRAITRVLTTQHFPAASPPTASACRRRARTANSGCLVFLRTAVATPFEILAASSPVFFLLSVAGTGLGYH